MSKFIEITFGEKKFLLNANNIIKIEPVEGVPSKSIIFLGLSTVECNELSYMINIPYYKLKEELCI